jgi:hypothetical protein
VRAAAGTSGIKDDDSGVPGPNARDVDFERRPLLFLPDGRALVRRAGF